MNTRTDARVVENRIACYRLLSANYCFPEGDFIEQTELRCLVDALRDLGSSAEADATRMCDSIEADRGQALRVAYSALFIGPFQVPAPPYGSVYLDDGRRVFGDSTLDVIARYLEAGVQMDPSQRDMPDHIAVELEFMAFLAAMQLSALHEGRESEVKEASALQATFLADHLGAWVPKFAEAIRGCEPIPFYDALASCTSAFVLDDLRSMREGVAA